MNLKLAFSKFLGIILDVRPFAIMDQQTALSDLIGSSIIEIVKAILIFICIFSFYKIFTGLASFGLDNFIFAIAGLFTGVLLTVIAYRVREIW